MTSLAAFVLASLALVAIPGPNLIYIVTRSVEDGRRAGIVSALGVETGTLVHVLAAVGGLATVIADHPLAFTLLRYTGAAYLAYLGVRALMSRPTAVGEEADPATPPTRRRLRRLYGDAVLVNLFNPKVVLFFLAFFPQFLPRDLSAGETRAHMLVLGLVFLAIALTLDLGYAALGAALTGTLRGTPRRAQQMAYVTGGIYLGLTALVFV
ncbi:LysE family translocator [Yinghuangia seranimata]|uniref:LysE family translocator n=1 Tax=Yinghuangia seranimata TaxID=408067 RepID=UPI00248A9B47|nr:LysE family translocator [Yinghuangia seranimata]MDI2124833.1 LysE family translocator [Yinghuangia seranimata]